MGLQETSLAAAVGAAVKNVSFAPDTANLPRKILIIGTYDPAKTLVVDETPVQITSVADAGDRFGFGYMVHRLAKYVFSGSDGVECWVCPQSEPSGAQAAGDITFADSTCEAGTLYLYIAGELVRVAITKAMADTALATATAAAINANVDLPVTAAVNGVTAEKVDITAKTEGTYGNDISITLNEGFGEELPSGMTASITGMSSGSGTPTIADALNGLGTGDDSNELWFTDVVHGYLQDTTTLDAISAYVGEGNVYTGCYAKTVARPFRVLTGDVATGSAGLTAVKAVGDARKLDRANGVICVPGSPNHPSEIAAVAIGLMAKTNNDRAAESYIGKVLPGIIPGASGTDRWTSQYDNRDSAVKSGCSPTVIDNGAVVLQNVLTFYHPDNVADSSNGYRSMRNISIVQNMLYNVKLRFSAEKWQGISIVADLNKVSSALDKEKARDVGTVEGELVSLATGFEGKAWIFSGAFTIDRIAAGGLVTIRDGGIGFNSTLPVILSGEGGIFDTVVEFDTSLAVLLG